MERIYEKVYDEKLTYTCGMNFENSEFYKEFFNDMKNYQNRLVNKKLRPVVYTGWSFFVLKLSEYFSSQYLQR